MSNTQNHHFGRFDQRCGTVANFEPQFFRGIRSDDRSNVLFPIANVTCASNPSNLSSSTRPIS